MNETIWVTYEGRNFKLGLPPKKIGESTGEERISLMIEQGDREREIEAIKASQEADTISSLSARISNTPTIVPAEPEKSLLETRTAIFRQFSSQ